MRGDFSRPGAAAARSRRSVVWQRGRVVLDADWNEAVELQAAALEALASDLLGAAGSPSGAALDVTVTAGVPTLTAGRSYVDSSLVEVEAATPLTAQADLPGYALPSVPGRYLAYLDVWLEGLGWLDSPELLEPALDGEESALRSRAVAQVRLLAVDAAAGPELFRPGWQPAAAPRPRLAARLAGSPANNQLYRLEVHAAGGLGTATWKWSRDNASVTAGVLSITGTTLAVRLPPRADALAWFPPGGWVEATSRSRRLRGEPGVLARVLTTSPGASPTVTVEAWPGGVVPVDVDRLVRWDSPGALPLAQATANGGFVPLEEGLEVRFSGEAAAVATSGDAWLLPLRATAGLLSEEDAGARADAATAEPDEVRHHYAPLRLLERTAGGWQLVADGDCRALFAGAGTIDLAGKVDRSGDTRSGPLTVDSHLLVSGQTRVGPVAADSTARLAVADGGSRLGASSRLLFPALGAAAASLSASGNELRLAVVGGSLRLAQAGGDRLVLSGGRVGIGTVAPQVDVEIAGSLRAGQLTVASELVIVDGNQRAGRALTAVDASGLATWQALSEQQLVRPTFFQRPVIVAQSGGSSFLPLVNYVFPANTLPVGATAVILEGRAAANSPDSGAIDHFLRARRDDASPWLVLLRARAAGGSDNGSWAGVGVFPLNTNPDLPFHFQYSVQAFAGGQDVPPTGGAFPQGWRIRAVGFFL